LIEMNASRPKPLFSTESDGYHVEHGTIREVKVLDQFGPAYNKSISKYNTPAAICGYVSVANAYYIASQLDQLPYECTVADVDNILKDLNNAQLIVSNVEKVMQFIQDDRRDYIHKYQHEFKSVEDEKKYMLDWVANYEIGDWLTTHFSKQVHFFRHLHKSVEPGTPVDHEEERRLPEEEPFLPRKYVLQSQDGSEKSPRSVMRIGEDFVQYHKGQQLNPVFIVDVIGHFVVGKPLLLKGGDREDHMPVFLCINSTVGNYLRSSSFPELFDLWFNFKENPNG